MSGDTSVGLRGLCGLTVRRRSGLFSDLVAHTKNRLSLHINSGGVNAHICYDIPDTDEGISVSNLFSRVPDLYEDFSNISSSVLYSPVTTIKFDHEKGFHARVSDRHFPNFRSIFEDVGYTISFSDKSFDLSCGSETFEANLPMFMHTYLNKMFESIPQLYITPPVSRRCTLFSVMCNVYCFICVGHASSILPDSLDFTHSGNQRRLNVANDQSGTTSSRKFVSGIGDRIDQ